MRDILASLPRDSHPDLLVGLGTSDDAGVIRLTPDLALIQTVDFFTPIVDDPYEFGRIAAANALSDVYAMGGVPLAALNIVCFPVGDLRPSVLAEILRGGADKLREAGVHLAGGHSVDDPEPKYGMAVTGTVHPDRIATNAGARPGDLLVLTKPLGTGVVTTAGKAGAAGSDALRAVVDGMATLNRGAAQAMSAVGIGAPGGVHAATDITGFGLLGHLSHVAQASDVTLRIFSGAVPLYPDVLSLAAAGFTTTGGRANREYLEPLAFYSENVTADVQETLTDPQTSGGLCIAVAPDAIEALLRELVARDVGTQAVIGAVEAHAEGRPRIIVE